MNYSQAALVFIIARTYRNNCRQIIIIFVQYIAFVLLIVCKYA